MPNWLSGALFWFFGNLLWDFILASVVAVVIAWLRKKKEEWAAPILYGLNSFVAVFVLAFTLVGHALFQPQTTPKNVEANISAWAKTFHLIIQSQSITQRPDLYFLVEITLPEKRKILIYRPTERERYLEFNTLVTVSLENQAILSNFSKERQNQAMDELNLELARSKMNYSLNWQPWPLRGIVLTKTVPITDALTQDAFIGYVDEMNLEITLASEAVTLAIQHTRH